MREVEALDAAEYFAYIQYVLDTQDKPVSNVAAIADDFMARIKVFLQCDRPFLQSGI